MIHKQSLVGYVMCGLYFGSLRERFASLKSLRMIKTESGCFCYVSVIGYADIFADVLQM